MTFNDVASGDKTVITKTPIVAELMGICPNQPCKLSVLLLSYIINVS